MDSPDWRAPLLAGLPLRSAAGDDTTAPAAVSWSPAELGGHEVVLAAWDWSVAGGSFGERDATTWVEATAYAVSTARPVVALVRSGGTRLGEGVPALVGMARATLARQRLAEAGVPLVAVADQPTTGGVFVTVVARADLRCAVAGAVVGFGGPRVVEAVTGSLPGPGSHTAAAAAAAGTVDAVVEPGQVVAWVVRTLEALAGRPELASARVPLVPGAGVAGGYDGVALEAAAGGGVDAQDLTLGQADGWRQVLAARAPGRPSAGRLLDELLTGAVGLAAPHGDTSVRAAVGQLAGGAAVGVALAADRGGRPSPDGYRLLARAARLADRLDLPLVTLVDTPGADPSPAAEADGLAGTLAEALRAVLVCRSPTLGVLVGEGGSGGALAGLVCDLVLISPSAYFAALVPEGAAVTLRTTPAEAADRLRLRPADVLAAGVADAVVPDAGDPAFTACVGDALAALAEGADGPRRAAREQRWSGPAPSNG